MKKRLFNILCIALSVLSLTCCKKEEQNTTQKYLTGYFNLDFPRFLHPGDSRTLATEDLATLETQPGDEKLAISYCIINSATGKTDTLINSNGNVLLSKYDFTAPDEIGRYRITLRAAATGYSPAYLDCEYDVVLPGWNEGASLTNYELEEDQEILVDERDGRSYLVSRMGDVMWMRTNLQWDELGKPCYEDEAAGDVFGRYYTFAEAVEACPAGWSLPSEEDWVALAEQYVNAAEPFSDIQGAAGALMENIHFNGISMWEFWPSVKISNAARFSAIPTGRASIVEDAYSFHDFGFYAMYWTSENNGDNAGVRYINVKNPDLYYVEVDTASNAFPVRCVRKLDGE